jgi:outer membrane protein assembly factor BamB
MRPLPLLTALLLGTLSALRPLPAAEPIQHRFLCSDYSGGKVCIVNTAGTIEWEFPAKNPQDCWMLPNGNILFSHLTGVKEVTLGKEVVWEYQGPAGVEIHNAQPLEDGNVMLIECGTKRLIEVNRAGQIVKEIPLHPNPAVRTHGQFRGGRKLANGHYVVPFLSERKVVELDGNGNVVREVPVPGFPSGVVALPNGNWLVANGDGHQVLEIAPDGKTVWQLNENDLPGNPIRWAIGTQRLPNGNTVFCNWLGHGHIGENPLLYEVTPERKLVWSFADHAHFKAISQIQILDAGVLGKPWEIQR